jgi:hypothetical protein
LASTGGRGLSLWGGTKIIIHYFPAALKSSVAHHQNQNITRQPKKNPQLREFLSYRCLNISAKTAITKTASRNKISGITKIQNKKWIMPTPY